MSKWLNDQNIIHKILSISQMLIQTKCNLFKHEATENESEHNNHFKKFSSFIFWIQFIFSLIEPITYLHVDKTVEYTMFSYLVKSVLNVATVYIHTTQCQR